MKITKQYLKSIIAQEEAPPIFNDNPDPDAEMIEIRDSAINEARSALGSAITRVHGKGKETAAQRKTRMQSSFTKVRGKPTFDDRQKSFFNTHIRIKGKPPTKNELRAAGVGKGGDNPAGVKAWNKAMDKLKNSLNGHAKKEEYIHEEIAKVKFPNVQAGAYFSKALRDANVPHELAKDGLLTLNITAYEQKLIGRRHHPLAKHPQIVKNRGKVVPRSDYIKDEYIPETAKAKEILAILKKFPAEARRVKAGEHISDKKNARLYDVLDTYFNKKEPRRYAEAQMRGKDAYGYIEDAIDDVYSGDFVSYESYNVDEGGMGSEDSYTVKYWYDKAGRIMTAVLKNQKDAKKFLANVKGLGMGGKIVRGVVKEESVVVVEAVVENIIARYGTAGLHALEKLTDFSDAGKIAKVAAGTAAVGVAGYAGYKAGKAIKPKLDWVKKAVEAEKFAKSKKKVKKAYSSIVKKESVESVIDEGGIRGKYAKDVPMFQKGKARKNTGKKTIKKKKSKAKTKNDEYSASAISAKIGKELAKGKSKGKVRLTYNEYTPDHEEDINEAIMVNFNTGVHSAQERWGRVHARDLVDKLKKAKVKHKTDKKYYVTFDIQSYNNSALAKKMSVGELIADIQKNNGSIDFSERDAMGRKKQFKEATMMVRRKTMVQKMKKKQTPAAASINTKKSEKRAWTPTPVVTKEVYMVHTQKQNNGSYKWILQNVEHEGGKGIKRVIDSGTESSRERANRAGKNAKRKIKMSEEYIANLKEAVDKDMVQELLLYITNDGQLYRSRTSPIIKNMSKKVGKGTYDGLKAEKAFMYLVKDGIKKYEKEFGNKLNASKETKQSLARELLDNYTEEIGESYEKV